MTRVTTHSVPHGSDDVMIKVRKSKVEGYRHFVTCDTSKVSIEGALIWGLDYGM